MRNLVTDGEREHAPARVAIVGGGAAGVITATHLLRKAKDTGRPLDVRIIEKDSTMGPGLAYRTPQPLHTLNNFAARLSAVDGDPDHLLRWCADRGLPAEPTSFLPRKLYGRYLADVLDHAEVPSGSMLRRNRGVVTDVRRDGPDLTVEMSCGLNVSADKVVLALGNPPPRRQPEFEVLGERYLPDPWVEHLAESVSGSDQVLLLGTGLTTVDVVAQLHEAAPATRFTAVSRRGLLPTAHKRGSLRLHDLFHPGTASLDELLDRVRDRIQELEEIGGDWRDVVDSLRTCANELWQGFTPEDQDRFVASVARRWEVARHRMSPEMAAHIERLQQSGTLRIAKVDEVDLSRFDRIINCTGPSPVPVSGWNRLVDTLLQRGAIRANRLGLGLDLDPDGRIVDTAGRPNPDVYAVGAARRGIEWEVAAIPDLRNQAAQLASHLVTDSASPAGRATGGRDEIASA